MRDILICFWIFFSLPLCFIYPFYGLVVFTNLAYMRTHDLGWGVARTLRLSFYVAIFFLLGYFLNHKGRKFIPSIKIYLMVILISLVFLSVALNFYPDREVESFAWRRVVELAKIFLVCSITPALVNSPKRLRILFWTIALSLGFYAFKNGVFGLLGARADRGPGGMIEDNNAFALALCMNFPFLFYLGKDEKNPTVKRIFLGLSFLNVIAVMITFSRGGFITMAVVFMLLIWKSSHRFLVPILIPLGFFAFFLMAPASYIERIKGITTAAQEDPSAQGRLFAWKAGYRMVRAKPVIGVGYENFVPMYIYYRSSPDERPRVAHNTYVQMAAETGLPTFVVFLGIILLTFLSIRRVRRKAKKAFGDSWFIRYADCIEVSILGYMAGGMFLNEAHFDLFYTLVALMIALETILEKEILRKEKHLSESSDILRENLLKGETAFVLQR